MENVIFLFVLKEVNFYHYKDKKAAKCLVFVIEKKKSQFGCTQRTCDGVCITFALILRKRELLLDGENARK